MQLNHLHVFYIIDCSFLCSNSKIKIINNTTGCLVGIVIIAPDKQVTQYSCKSGDNREVDVGWSSKIRLFWIQEKKDNTTYSKNDFHPLFILNTTPWQGLYMTLTVDDTGGPYMDNDFEFSDKAVMLRANEGETITRQDARDYAYKWLKK